MVAEGGFDAVPAGIEGPAGPDEDNLDESGVAESPEWPSFPALALAGMSGFLSSSLPLSGLGDGRVGGAMIGIAG